MLSQSYLKECLDYDANTGLFTWRKRPDSHFKTVRHMNIWNARYAYKQAGHATSIGYVLISINSRAYRAHSLAYLFTHGFIPPIIDHKNAIPSDNKISNLRAANKRQNGANRTDVSASSGVKGVSWHKARGGWQVRVCGKYVGIFSTLEAAASAYEAEARRVFGDFARVVIKSTEAHAA